jgi:hypothetical protein
VRAGKNERVPEFVFLAHVVDIMSSMHVPFVLRSISSVPFENHLVLLPFWPVAFTGMLLIWCLSKTFLVSFYYLRGRLHQTWTVPRHGFQYFIPAAKRGINNQIELAILRADRMGVKVLSLAALNKVPNLPIQALFTFIFVRATATPCLPFPARVCLFVRLVGQYSVSVAV